MITTTIELGGITFEDVAFDGWSFTGLTDWWGQTARKGGVEERPLADGAFEESTVLRSSRAISFVAQYIGGAQADAENAFDDLAAVGASGPVEMIVRTPAGASARRVTVENVEPVDHRGRRFGQIAVDLIARDPRRYALGADVPWLTSGPPSPGLGRTWPAVWPLIWPGGGSSGRIALTNVGKASSAPQFRLLGGFSTAMITCVETGSRIGFDRFVPAGSVVEIDTSNHTATIDGQSDVSGWLRWREWEMVPAGETRTFQFDVTDAVGSPQLEGRVLSAWP